MLRTASNDRRASLDLIQIAAVLGLMLISVAFVFSATSANGADSAVWYRQTWLRQVVWFALGTSAAGLVCLVDYHVICRWAMVGYWLSIASLLALFVFASTHNGARRWIDLGPFQLQPSEFAKLAFIIAEANFLSRPPDELRMRGNFWKAIGLMLLPFFLVLREPDLGSSLGFLSTGLVMLYIAGTPPRYLARIMAAACVITALFLGDVLYAPPQWRVMDSTRVLKQYQFRRLLVYFGRDYVKYAGGNPTVAEKKKLHELWEKDSYNIHQALISIGSGGLLGQGWRQGRQNVQGFLPSLGKHNDFIFSVIAEEAGFLGSVIVLTLYAVVLFAGIRIAGQARDRLGKLLAVGVVTLLFSHVFINIGINISILPATGIPLPLLSYGGSSVLGSLIAVGILQNICIYRKAY